MRFFVLLALMPTYRLSIFPQESTPIMATLRVHSNTRNGQTAFRTTCWATYIYLGSLLGCFINNANVLPFLQISELFWTSFAPCIPL